MKKLVSLVLALVLLLGMSTTALAFEHPLDVQNASTASTWAQSDVQKAFDSGFLSSDMDGYSVYSIASGAFRDYGRSVSEGENMIFVNRNQFAETANFQAQITRGEFAKMMVIWIMYATNQMPGDLTSRMGSDVLGHGAGPDKWAEGPWSNGGGIWFDRDFKSYYPDIEYGYDDYIAFVDGGYYQNGETVEHPYFRIDDVIIKYAYEFGVVAGTRVEDRRVWFSPNDTLTREQAATMITRAVNFVNFVGTEHVERKYETDMISGYMVKYNEADMWNQEDVWAAVRAATNAPAASYKDTDQISSWAADAINYCTANGILSGLPDGSFNPKGNYTIEQAIVTLSRIGAKDAPEAPTDEPAQTEEPSNVDADDTMTLHIFINGEDFGWSRVNINDKGEPLLNARVLSERLGMGYQYDLPLDATIVEAEQLLGVEIELVDNVMYVTKK